MYASYLIGLAMVIGGIAWGLITFGLSAIFIGLICLAILAVGVWVVVEPKESPPPKHWPKHWPKTSKWRYHF